MQRGVRLVEHSREGNDSCPCVCVRAYVHSRCAISNVSCNAETAVTVSCDFCTTPSLVVTVVCACYIKAKVFNLLIAIDSSFTFLFFFLQIDSKAIYQSLIASKWSNWFPIQSHFPIRTYVYNVRIECARVIMILMALYQMKRLCSIDWGEKLILCCEMLREWLSQSITSVFFGKDWRKLWNAYNDGLHIQSSAK
jgi:hypothetical protein